MDHRPICIGALHGVQLSYYLMHYDGVHGVLADLPAKLGMVAPVAALCATQYSSRYAVWQPACYVLL
jgi:hypothetical protein